MIAFAPSRLLILLLALMLAGTAGPAAAASGARTKVNTKLLGTFENWKAETAWGRLFAAYEHGQEGSVFAGKSTGGGGNTGAHAHAE